MTARELLAILNHIATHAPDKMDGPIYVYTEGQRRSLVTVDWHEDITDAVDINIQPKVYSQTLVNLPKII